MPATNRKPLKVGLDYVRNLAWEPKLFTRAGAQREMDRGAKLSPLHGAVGRVSDMGEYWRGNVAAMPFERG